MKVPFRKKATNWHQDESHGVIETWIWFKFGWILGKFIKFKRSWVTLTLVPRHTRRNLGTTPPKLMIFFGKEWVCYNILQKDADWNQELAENQTPGSDFATGWCQVCLFIFQCFGNISRGSQLVLEAFHQRNRFCPLLPLLPMKVPFCKRREE